jgi:hypothetical protein
MCVVISPLSIRRVSFVVRFRTRYDVFVGGFETEIQTDSLITATARAPAAGDPLGAVNRVAEAEIALVSRDLCWPAKALDAGVRSARRRRERDEARICADAPPRAR